MQLVCIRKNIFLHYFYEFWNYYYFFFGLLCKVNLLQLQCISERDTELIRVRLECQRLLEENREVKEQLKHIQSYTNPKKQVEMEKEIENLKWHLSIVSSSLKKYIYAMLSTSVWRKNQQKALKAQFCFGTIFSNFLALLKDG